VRNRIISGLCRALVVVESGLRGGSLITARHAADQSRDVFAVPGPVFSPQSQGCHHLIRDGGAKIFTKSSDLWEDDFTSSPHREQPELPPAGLPVEAVTLLGLIGDDPAHIDLLVRESGLMPQEVTALLINLEMAGLISQQPGKNFVRI
jgi:DNA processing protein